MATTLSQVKSTGSEVSDVVSSEKKTCADCGTTKTPLWRGGPAGPKSLCNACGIRSRKKRRAILGMNKSSSTGMEEKKSKKMAESVKQKIVRLRCPFENKKLMRKLGEEEQAAVLLMALSYGSVYAYNTPNYY